MRRGTLTHCLQNTDFNVLLLFLTKHSVIQVDDTLPGIGEGLNAGMWTVGVIQSGNELGLHEHEIPALHETDLKERLEKGRQRFQQAGAHYAIRSVADLLPVIEDINRRLAKGEKP